MDASVLWSSPGICAGPTCFVVFINYLDEVLDLVDGFISKFADDTKYGRIICNEEDYEKMQSNIVRREVKWAEMWQNDGI